MFKTKALNRLSLLSLGPLLGITLAWILPLPSFQSKKMILIAVWMATWWITEVIPLSITSLLPLILFPIFGIMSMDQIAPLYMNHIIFLFLGGFLFAIAIEKWHFHYYLLSHLLRHLKGTLTSYLFGFMFLTFFLSMWLNNTSSVLFLIPIIQGFFHTIPHFSKQQKAIFLLGIAYSASIGGTATLIGTAPNLVLQALYEQHYGNEFLSFATWLFLVGPLSFILLCITFLYLSYWIKKGHNNKTIFYSKPKEPKSLNYEQKIIAFSMLTTLALWIFRQPISFASLTLPSWTQLFPHPEYLKDSTVIIAIVTILFLIPSKQKPSTTILTITDFQKVPFSLLLLFGGGFALAKGLEITQVTQWLVSLLISLEIPWYILSFLLIFAMIFLTEITSNTTATLLTLPILITYLEQTNTSHPSLLLGVTLAASMAFMLPIATPPNTIVYGTGNVPAKLMAKIGFLLNMIASIIIFSYLYLVFS